MINNKSDVAKMKALIISSDWGPTCPLSSLLYRSGFKVEVITSGFFSKEKHLLKKRKFLEANKFISKYEIVLDKELILEKLVSKNCEDYHIIFASDDIMLKVIADSDIDIAKKLHILPVQSEGDIKHIYSKIGFSEVLKKANIRTPSFLVAKG